LHDTTWYQRWFGSDYLRLYRHRSTEEAERTVKWLTGELTLPEGARILDLACGRGRHLKFLRNYGYRAFGLDLSWTLLKRAQEEEIRWLVRGDMRFLPWKRECFDTVLSLFTSFGYFDDDEQNFQVLKEAVRVLKTGGCFILDFLNADEVRRRIVPSEETTIGNCRAEILRWLDEPRRRVEKRILIYESHRALREYRESVKLYSENELRDFLALAGMTVERIYGDYHGEPFRINSPRLIIRSRKGS
jgi:SAM-dependent methyltransferase